MTLRIDGAGFNLAMAGWRDPVLSAGGVYLLDDRSRYVRPGLAFARAQQVYGVQGDGSLTAYTGSQVPWEAQGVRVDPGWVQRALSTDSFTTAAWTAADTVPTDNAFTAADGTVYAKVVASATTSTHLIRQTITYTLAEVTTITLLFKPAEENVLVVRAGSGGTVWGSMTPVFATFDASTGTATAGTHGVSPTMVPAKDGGWLCSVTTVATTAAGNAQVHLVLRQTTAYLGNGTSGLFVSRFNVTNTAYRVPLTTAVATAVTVPSFSFSGLLADMGITLGSEYTIGCESIYITPLAASSHIARLDDGSDTNRVLFYRPGSGTSVSSLATSANAGVYIGTATSAGMTLNKQTMRVKLNNMSSATNGVLLAADDGASAMPIGLNRLVLGHGASSGSSVTNGWIRKLWLVPSLGLSDTQLQALSV